MKRLTTKQRLDKAYKKLDKVFNDPMPNIDPLVRKRKRSNAVAELLIANLNNNLEIKYGKEK